MYYGEAWTFRALNRIGERYDQLKLSLSGVVYVLCTWLEIEGHGESMMVVVPWWGVDSGMVVGGCFVGCPDGGSVRVGDVVGTCRWSSRGQWNSKALNSSSIPPGYQVKDSTGRRQAANQAGCMYTQ